MHSVRIELAKLILVGTRITYQATGDCCIAAVAYKRCANHRFCLAPDVRPNSTATPRPCGHTDDSSKKASLLEGESGLTPARKTHPTCYEPDTACLTACLAEAARGTEHTLYWYTCDVLVMTLWIFSFFIPGTL